MNEDTKLQRLADCPRIVLAFMTPLSTFSASAIPKPHRDPLPTGCHSLPTPKGHVVVLTG